MPVSEAMVQDIDTRSRVRMQLSGTAQGAYHGVFADMNDAIAAAKEAQKKVRVMTMDQREQIISNIRRKNPRERGGPGTHGRGRDRNGKRGR